MSTWRIGHGRGVLRGSVGNRHRRRRHIYVGDASNDRIQVFSYHEDPPVYLFQWGNNGGGTGEGQGEFNNPYGIAIDTDGNVYVVDAATPVPCRVQKFDADGNYDLQWGSYGSTNSTFDGPHGIAADLYNKLYVADSGNNRIQVFSSTGEYNRQWGSAGTGDREFNSPNDVAVDSDNYVYVADPGNHRIQKFESTGDYNWQWGSYGQGDGEFFCPNGVAVSSGGTVYVADTYNNRIQKFDTDGTWLATWGGTDPGTGDGQFYRPTYVAVDPDGNVYVSDSWNHRIQKFDSEGDFLTKWGSLGAGDSEFAYTQGIAINADGDIYVVDNGNQRVQVFGEAPTVDVVLGLKTGWNMVSVPLELADASRDAVFPPADVVAVYTWNPASKSYGIPDTIEPEVGYWVAVTEDKTIEVTGMPVTEWDSDLTTGWNMVGSVHGASVPVATIITDQDPDPLVRNAVYWWDPTGKSYTSTEQIDKGKGHWVAAMEDCCLTMCAPV